MDFNKLVFTAIYTLVLDAIYLFSNKHTFELQVASVQRVSLQINYLGVFLCYLLIITGLYYFIIRKRRPILEAFLLGIFVYGVYETTSYSILKKWELGTVVMDTIWGGVLFGIVTQLVYWTVE